MNDWARPGNYYCDDRPLSSETRPDAGITRFLEDYLRLPVIDQTGLTQNFQIDLKWSERGNGDPYHNAIKQALFDQLGLELVPSREPVEMLVMGKAN